VKADVPVQGDTWDNGNDGGAPPDDTKDQPQDMAPN
jgi:hypothetical protein